MTNTQVKQEQQSPQSPVFKSLFKHQDSPQKRTRNNTGKWTQIEEEKYYLFLYHHQRKFKNRSLKKSLKIFKLMAFYIGSRSSSQCRTHHELIQKKGDIIGLLKELIKEDKDFLNRYQQVKQKLEICEDTFFCEMPPEERGQEINHKTRQVPQQNQKQQRQSTIGFSSQFPENYHYDNFMENGNQSMDPWLESFRLFQLWTLSVSSLISNQFEK